MQNTGGKTKEDNSPICHRLFVSFSSPIRVRFNVHERTTESTATLDLQGRYADPAVTGRDRYSRSRERSKLQSRFPVSQMPRLVAPAVVWGCCVRMRIRMQCLCNAITMRPQAALVSLQG
ncbi:hypothetical protein LSAT2_029727 [Lamellibrachia satsuma]|nr:hypothetical protein LSAT2_029727 [Lamellibrachia satsuma]